MTGPKQFKFCKSCQTSKSVEDFYRRTTGYLSVWCKPCTIKANNQARSEKRRAAREARLALPPAAEKACTQCGETKRLGEFYAKHAECKECFRARSLAHSRRPEVRARVAVQGATYRAENRARIRKQSLVKYGITPERYDALYDRQQGGCAVCGSPGERLGAGGKATRYNVLVVDHCLDTGAVRGLLCQTCNRAIGLLKDDPDHLRRAIAYLTASRGEVTNTEVEAASNG